MRGVWCESSGGVWWECRVGGLVRGSGGSLVRESSEGVWWECRVGSLVGESGEGRLVRGGV